MEDGVKADCMGTSIGMSNLPEEKYPEDTEDFGRYLVTTFTEQGIKPRMVNWEKLDKKLSYEYWREYAHELRLLAGE